MRKFKPTKKSPTGTYLIGYYPANYKDLETILGPPNGETDGYKVSTEWILEDYKGNVVTIYDYKGTTMYDDCYPSVEEFRLKPFYDWHIGGSDTKVVSYLKDFLSTKIMEVKISQFKELWRNERMYIHYDLKDKEIRTFITNEMGNVPRAVDRFADYILSQGLADGVDL